jgi:prevent-host-death family protein
MTMAITVGVFEAKNKLSELLDRAERGEEIVITRNGKPVARLRPYKVLPGSTEAIEAGRRIRELAKKMRLKATPEEVKSWINEGRK